MNFQLNPCKLFAGVLGVWHSMKVSSLPAFLLVTKYARDYLARSNSWPHLVKVELILFCNQHVDYSRFVGVTHAASHTLLINLNKIIVTIVFWIVHVDSHIGTKLIIMKSGCLHSLLWSKFLWSKVKLSQKRLRRSEGKKFEGHTDLYDKGLVEFFRKGLTLTLSFIKI